jgi:hypothetical protein
MQSEVEEEVEKEVEKEVEEVSKTLHFSLPLGDMPLPMKIIAFLTSIGGLSITASVLADIVRPDHIPIYLYILRIITGALMLLIGYGIIKKRQWAIWLYASISLVSLSVNPLLAILPVAITMYLFHKEEYFTGGTLKEVWEKFSHWLHELEENKK